MRPFGRINFGRSRAKETVRRNTLALLDERLGDGSVLFLRRPVTVEDDFLGCGFPHTVRSVARIPGHDRSSREFSLGTHLTGMAVTTDSVSTEDLVRLAAET